MPAACTSWFPACWDHLFCKTQALAEVVEEHGFEGMVLLQRWCVTTLEVCVPQAPILPGVLVLLLQDSDGVEGCRGFICIQKILLSQGFPQCWIVVSRVRRDYLHKHKAQHYGLLVKSLSIGVKWWINEIQRANACVLSSSVLVTAGSEVIRDHSWINFHE